jgi:sugar O-acyltransferase (sialic acid O-acetyltransferase NeuD family)
LSKPLLVLGAGGHASVLVDILRQQDQEIIGLVAPDIEVKNQVFSGIKHFTNDDDILNFDSQSINLINGIGSLPDNNNLRIKLFNKYKDLGYTFESTISSKAIVSDYSQIGEGVQILAGAIIQTGACIGLNTIINSGAIIEHDCIIGQNNHIAPGVSISGNVVTSKGVHIGTGASIIQSLSIGKNSIIAAGAIVTKDVDDNTVFFSSKGTSRAINEK